MLFIHAEKTSLKTTQLEKVHIIKVNELKLTQVELIFSFVCFKRAIKMYKKFSSCSFFMFSDTWMDYK